MFTWSNSSLSDQEQDHEQENAPAEDSEKPEMG
jgi:hypothetical protein